MPWSMILQKTVMHFLVKQFQPLNEIKLVLHDSCLNCTPANLLTYVGPYHPQSCLFYFIFIFYQQTLPSFTCDVSGVSFCAVHVSWELNMMRMLSLASNFAQQALMVLQLNTSLWPKKQFPHLPPL